MPSVGKASCQSLFLSFIVTPREMKVRNGRAKKITLAAVPACPNFVPNAELLATVKHHKRTLKYSHKLKELLKKLKLTTSDLKPLEKYLKTQLTQSRKNPELPIGVLDNYLKNGVVPNFTIDFHPRNPPVLDTITVASS